MALIPVLRLRGALLVCIDLVGILSSVAAEPSRLEGDARRNVKIVYCIRDIPVGAVVTASALQERVVQESNRPAHALYDTWIAVGRPSRKPIKNGEPVFFDQLFSDSEWRVGSNYFDHERAQLDSLDVSMDSHRKIPIVYCVKAIALGAMVTSDALAIGEVEACMCPADGVGDVWVAIGRVSRCAIKVGELVYYHQVIPKSEWDEFKIGKPSSKSLTETKRANSD